MGSGVDVVVGCGECVGVAIGVGVVVGCGAGVAIGVGVSTGNTTVAGSCVSAHATSKTAARLNTLKSIAKLGRDGLGGRQTVR